MTPIELVVALSRSALLVISAVEDLPRCLGDNMWKALLWGIGTGLMLVCAFVYISMRIAG